MQNQNREFIRETTEDLVQIINYNRKQFVYDVLFFKHLPHEQLKQIDLSSLTMRQSTILKAYRNCDHRSIKIYQDRVYGFLAEIKNKNDSTGE